MEYCCRTNECSSNVSMLRKRESVSNKDSKYDETVACSMFLGFHICLCFSLVLVCKLSITNVCKRTNCNLHMLSLLNPFRLHDLVFIRSKYQTN